MNSENRDMNKSIIYLTQVETLAQDILTLKYEKLELSNARNKYNEGMRALQQSDQRRTLIDFDCTLFEFPTKVAINLLKEDINKATDDIDRLHQDIRNKVSQLRDLEHEPKIVGIGLKPMSAAEAKAIHKGFNME